MKVALETIPVMDALRKNTECPICDLMKRAEEDALSYYLGPAIMVPERRVEINGKGFCQKHFKDLAECGHAQPLALVLDTYYEESKKSYKGHFERIAKAGGKERKILKEFEALRRDVEKRDSGCLVCDYMSLRLERYLETFAALYHDDPEFRELLSSSKGFCIHHALDLASAAKSVLRGDEFGSFLTLLSKLLDENLDRVQNDVWRLTQKYKSENADKPWDGCEDAHKRGVLKLVGEGLVLS